jgi:glutamine cyclotransferase
VIAIISPETGEVKAWIDLQDLLGSRDRKSTDVLNGIAYDSEGDRLFVTGKFWPSLFEIKLKDKGNCSTSSSRLIN